MTDSFDVVVVGGGIVGSALGTMLARGGKSVLILEKTAEFVDVVRGEWLAPWGLIDAGRAGIYDDLLRANDHHIRVHVEYGDGIDPDSGPARQLDLSALLPGIPGPLAIGHPQACQALIDAAEGARASVIRGVSDVSVAIGSRPTVTYQVDGVRTDVTCRLIVGADGRGSVVRRQAGVELHQDPNHHYFAGMLVDGAEEWPDHVQSMGTEGDVQYFVFPQGGGRVRLYLGFAREQKSRFAGADNQQRFLDAFRLKTVPKSETIAEARPAGPCHTIPNQSTWVDRPAGEGFVLVGDAAGYNDPIIGQGLAVCMRDARSVGEILLGNDNWSEGAFSPYVEERAERMRRLRFVAAWDSVLHAEFGPEATARKLRVLERSAADPMFAPCRAAGILGPEVMPDFAFSDEEWSRLMSV